MRFCVPKLCPKFDGALNLLHCESCEPVSLMAYQDKLFADGLRKRSISDEVDKLASALSECSG